MPGTPLVPNSQMSYEIGKMWNPLAKNWDTRGVSPGENDLKIIELTKKIARSCVPGPATMMIRKSHALVHRLW